MAPIADGKRPNQVTLFSNGMGHFVKTFEVKKGSTEKISIPFRHEHIADVLESLSVFGNVRLESPPSFTPTNSSTTSLEIDPESAYRSLYHGLSGASVAVSVDGKIKKGTLLGLETERLENNATVDVLVILCDGKIELFELSKIDSVEFTEESVQAEITKALKKNFQEIKPDSTYVELTIADSSDEKSGVTEGTIQYKIPIAAWKMRYGIRQEGDKFWLDGAAIVDNNTDEDWANMLVSVVTGNPISFYSPDLAAVTIPYRQTVNIVENAALGAVQASESYAVAAVRAARMTQPAMAARSGVSYSTGFGAAEAFSAEATDDVELEAASVPGFDNKEVGDFSIFTSKEPINILSKQSAVVNMFKLPLKAAGLILIYKEKDHARRPYRAVKFKNESEYSLGKGKVVVFQDGIFSGEAVMETAKPGENRLLPYCLENGVRIVKKTHGQDNHISSLKLGDGFGITQTTFTAKTEYHIQNKKDEPFKLLIEHAFGLHRSENATYDGAEIKEIEKIPNGERIYLNLKPKEELRLVVGEKVIDTNKVKLSGNYRWLFTNIIGGNLPLAKDAQVLACVNIQKEIEKFDKKIASAKKSHEDLNQTAGRLRKNVEATASSSTEKRNEWIDQMDDTEKKIQELLNKTIPDLEKSRQDKEEELDKALQGLQAKWSE